MWTSSDVRWRPKLEFFISSHSHHGKRNIKSVVKDSWIRSHTRRRPAAQISQSWMGKNSLQLFISAPYRDEEKMVKCYESDSSVSKIFLSDFKSTAVRKRSGSSETFSIRDQVIEEPWLFQSSSISCHVSELKDEEILNCSNGDVLKSNFSNEFRDKGFCSKSDFKVNGMKKNPDPYDALVETYHPVEEPWLCESSAHISGSTTKMVSDIAKNVEDEATQPPLLDQHQHLPERLLHEEESNVMSEDSISTVILINSSICTMQRIAILENSKLVELLLEPVKNNVQCDSVYLGVVTKLVPHMGGAFVDIGSSRPSFMDISPNREPFTLPPFQSHTKEREPNDFIFDKLVEHVGNTEDETFTDQVEETDEMEDGQSEDEFIDDEYGGPEDGVDFDVLEAIKEHVNGSVSGHAPAAEPTRSLENLSEAGYQAQNRSGHHDISHKVIVTEESKWAQVKKGTKIIVQVVKEGLGTKGPTLTAYPKLRSRFWLLIARCNTIGISKKISGVERTRLRLVAKTLQPPGFGLTVRTVASGHSLDELQKDLERLLSTWKSIVEHAKSATLAADEGVDGAVPVMLHRAMGQTLSVAQDYFSEKVKSMVVDSPRTYHEVTNYLQEIAPDLCDRVELYSKRTPLFDEYRLEEEINSILSKRVLLDNGGYLVIEQTEALVSIDVNGGHCMLGQGTSQEKAILDVNLAAANQIARELRLRDIGGIIVVDFIDMLDDTNKRLVYDEVKKAVERDRSTVKVSELSRHGLMEITRKRVRPSVTFMISEPCTCCHATGRVEALETSFSKIEHEICRLLSMTDQKADPENPKSWPRFILRVDRHMCNYLTSGKRTRLAVLSSSLKVWILLKVARGLTRGSFELKPLTDDNLQKNQRQTAAISVLRPTDVTYTPNKKVTLFPIKKWKTGGK
ncbi:Ribonuclease E/G-like protein [Forsythia ovata]|uniref:Ribonuclease E/G-like protein n=1 Tax=Forsythia ovata TaxID=205694 RepID=A0ABD1PFI4_9LAMI